MTNFIEWSDEFSVGIQEIDEQHKVLIDLLNDLHDAITNRRAADVTDNILKRLDDYVHIHFAVEESLMRILHYPEYKQHKLKHDELIDQLTKLNKKLEAGRASISFELMYFLKMWLTKHILEIDKRFGPYFIQQGIKPKLYSARWTSRFVRFRNK